MARSSRQPSPALVDEAAGSWRSVSDPGDPSDPGGDEPPMAPRSAWDEPEDDRADQAIHLDAPRGGGPSRLRLAVLSAAASFAIVLLGAAGVMAVREWRAPDDRGATSVTRVQPDGSRRRIEAVTFSFDQPAGWQDRSLELRERLPTSPGVTAEYILSGPSSDGVLANISITRTQVPERQRSLDVLRQDFLVGLRNRNKSAEPIGAPIYLEVAGAEATSFEFRYRQRDVDVAGRAVICARERNVYLVLFQTGEVHYDLHVNALWELLESWRWR